jgi:class 3 adenylate cyclase
MRDGVNVAGRLERIADLICLSEDALSLAGQISPMGDR